LQRIEVTESFLNDIKELSRKIFVHDGMVLSYTDNISNKAEELLKSIVDFSDGKMRVQKEISISESGVEAIEIDRDTGYSGTVAKLPEGALFNGSMMVAAKIISTEYLYREIREIGGAYGTAMRISPSGRVAAYTYRNPTPVKSGEIIKNSGNVLRSFLNSNFNLDRFIVSTVAGVDSYKPPADEAFEPVELYVAGRSFTDAETVRKQILKTEKKELEAIFDMLNGCLSEARHFVVGGKRQVEAVPADKVEKLETNRIRQCKD
jgi:Zn-dependent M16 (insulinase) family peptidase